MNPASTLTSLPALQMDTQQICFGCHGVPEQIEKEVTSLLQTTGEDSPPPTVKMYRKAESIAHDYPTFICAQYALAAVAVSGQVGINTATMALDRAWDQGLKTLVKNKILEIHYQASQSNLSFLNTGAMLASFKILHNGLDSAVRVVDLAYRLDIDSGSKAIFVKAHIDQLRGMPTALPLLIKAAAQDPKAFFALGIEYLRRNKAKVAEMCLRQGLLQAPEVAEILLGRRLVKSQARRKNIAFAQAYVQTYKLNEWSPSEIYALVQVVNKKEDS